MFSETRASATDSASATWLSAIPLAFASSSCVGGRPSSVSSFRAWRFSVWRRSWTWVGTRIVRDWPAIERWTAYRIHQVAYVENLKPLR